MQYELGQIIKHDGDTWRVLSVGSVRDGYVYLHLASTTRHRKQKNGDIPIQIGDWLEL